MLLSAMSMQWRPQGQHDSWPRGLVEKALVFGAKYLWLEPRQGHCDWAWELCVQMFPVCYVWLWICYVSR